MLQLYHGVPFAFWPCSAGTPGPRGLASGHAWCDQVQMYHSRATWPTCCHLLTATWPCRCLQLRPSRAMMFPYRIGMLRLGVLTQPPTASNTRTGGARSGYERVPERNSCQ